MQAIPSEISKLVEVKSSPVHGKGMFAKKNILMNTVVFRWGGTFVNKDKLPQNRAAYVIVQVDDDLYSVEPRDSPEDDTYFINHSCNPNVWMVDAYTFVTSRDVRKGEELTVDYALFVSEDYVSKWTCRCGAKECRGKVTGKDYLISRLEKKYAGHFSPVISKKIMARAKR
jgi:SET domain-containing protein